MKIYTFFLLRVGLLTLSCPMLWAQSSPNLEFATQQGVQNPQGNGPAYNASINLVKNTNNPNGNTYVAYQPNLKVNFSIVGQNYSSAVIMGYNINDTSIPIYPKMNYIGTPSNNDFTSSGAPIGKGISISNNNGLSLFYNTAVLGNKYTGGTYPMADLLINFNRPVDDPILHIGAMGAFKDQLGLAGGFDLIDSNVPVTFSRVSGNNSNFSVTTTSIRNSSMHPNDIGTESASGSVRVNGKGITAMRLRMSVRGDGGQSTWGLGSGDLITFGISVLESDLAISTFIDNNTPYFDDIVTFTVKAKNLGASDNTDVQVATTIPDGYEILTASTVTGAFDVNTGIWNIGSLNDNSEVYLTIKAKVKSSGSYTLAASISGDLRDPNLDNNQSSITPLIAGRAVCYKDPNRSEVGTDSRFGITTLQRAGINNGNWPMVRKSAYLVLESNNKGFVITRMTSDQISSIVIPVEGMMVYDTTEKCLKLYSDNSWNCFTTATCP
ncbi:Uncharacterised protein [Chryseobacterium nakagawai]|uniref:DUF11 domain-containing protein n=1 Tax=Chryseobacterium nakagawai TaxID=1241982 RepID=A0AAD0YS05_CHRNA|nr:DUF11 domain-containing protein [Chryseobacterium nakagawai]AZA93613.1 DUF11 domain-containing protein [Chryseobacterium nakagawai]VEH20313.1 Uncharacterised protein [Chryseobacterium nakagawai]